MNIHTFNGQDLDIRALPAESNRSGSTEIPLKVLPIKKDYSYNFRKYNLYGSSYEIPEYNLYEISAAEDADGIIRRTIQKKRALISKAGWTLSGLNNRTVDYVKTRFKQLGLAQGKTMELLIKEIGGDLVRFHNAFLHKVRSKDSSGGRVRSVRTINGKKKLRPVAGYFRMAPETMWIKTDEYGNPKKYMQQMPDGRRQEYFPQDIIHIYFNRRAGMNFAAPGLLPAVDDVRGLRRIEEQVEVLVDQHLFPLITVAIGSDEMPVETYPDGTTEVDTFTKKIEEMPPSGVMVTSHRYKLDILQNANTLGVDKYLDHFKNRAYASAGVSSLDMGEGSGMNRSTADNASKILIDDVKDYQSEFREFINFEIINELLLEKYDISVLMEKNSVSFEWKEIDLDSMMKFENHNSVMHTMNQITEDEMRMRNGNKIIDSKQERKKLYMYTHEKQVIDWNTESAIEIANAGPAIPVASSNKTQTSTTKSSNKAVNKNTPTNQHGTKMSSEKKKSSMPARTMQLYNILGDFDTNDRDFTKNKVTNWCFSIDLPGYNKDFGMRILRYIDKYVDESFDKVESQNTHPLIAKDAFVLNIINFLDNME